MRSGTDLVVLSSVGGGVLFAALAVVAWVPSRRTAGLLLAALAGVDFAFAIAPLNR
jgi:hypothetical protein